MCLQNTSCQSPVASCPRRTLPSSLTTNNQQLPTAFLAFTLIEMLVVMSIMVLMLAMAVPVFRVLTGSRSIENAQNIIAATLGRVRNEAIGFQQERGVFFYIDPASDRIMMAAVAITDTKTIGAGDRANTHYFDLVADEDAVALPSGIGIQLIDNCSVTSGVRADDAYIGFNNASPSGLTMAKYGGIILFDSSGRTVNSLYGFRIWDATNTAQTALGRLLFNTGGGADFIPERAPAFAPSTQFGFVLFDREAFSNQSGFTDADPQVDSSQPGYGVGSAEYTEETWLDNNAVPFLINRYTGTLLKGE